MKKFKNYMAESQPENRPTFHRNPSNGYLDDQVVKKVNALIGRNIMEDSADPEGQIALIRNSLMKIGLTFNPAPPMVEESGEFSLPLTLFGGRFGKDVDTPHDEFLKDDGISHNIEGGLALHISYEITETNQCRLRAYIA